MASRQEEKERLRKEREAREAEAAAKKAKQATARKFALIGGGVLVVIAIVVGVVVAGGGGDSKSSSTDDPSELAFQAGPAPTKAIAIKDGSQKDLLAAAKKAGCTFNTNPNEGHEHEDPSSDFKYKANPPTSGNHTPTWAEDGAYPTDTYATPFLVHALEHGRIEYLWDPAKVTKQQLGSLKKLYDDDSYHVILHPTTTDMPYAIAAASWDHSLTCPKMNDDVFAALRLYKLNWIDQGREQVP
jgi:hypothetical protein